MTVIQQSEDYKIMDLSKSIEKFKVFLIEFGWTNLHIQNENTIIAEKGTFDQLKKMQFEIRIITNDTPDEKNAGMILKRTDTQYRGAELKISLLDDNGRVSRFGGNIYNLGDSIDFNIVAKLLKK